MLENNSTNLNIDTDLNAKKLFRAVFTTLLCNSLVWYDYALFGSLALVLSESFFPEGSEYAQLLGFTIAFATGFFARPIGALFFGYLGDRYSRRSALILSIFMMLCSSGLIAILPTYMTIGITSTFLLFFARILQGFSLGGEAGNAVFLVESAPRKYRSLIGSLEVLSAIIGPILCIVTILTIKSSTSVEYFNNTGWRIAFLVGIILGIFGLVARIYLHEPEEYKDSIHEKMDRQHPLLLMFRDFRKELLIAILIDAVEEVSLYTFLVFLTVSLGGGEEFLIFQAILLVILAVFTVFFAWLGDIVKKQRVIFFSAYVTLIAALPIFYNIYHASGLLYILSLVLFVLIIASSLGPMNATVCSLFPREVRYSGFAFSRNISSSVFGGLSPMISTLLVKYTGSKISPAIYLMFSAILVIVYLRKYNSSKQYI